MTGSPRVRFQRVLAWGVLLILLALTVHGAIFLVGPGVTSGKSSYTFYDLDILLDKLAMFRESGTLYETTRPDYFLPGTEVFKYPPPAAGLLLLLVDRNPSAERTPDELAARARPLILLSLFCMAATLGIVFWALRPPVFRAALILIIFFNWQALWETLIGPQLELLILLLVAVAWLGLWRNLPLLSGAPIGPAGALKIYPWILGIGFLARRQWRAFLALAAGAAATLVAAAAFLGWGLMFQYLTRILPRQGGTSVEIENLSLLGNLARFTALVTKRPGPPAAPPGGFAGILARPGPAGAPILAWIIGLPIIAGLIYASARALRRSQALSARTRECLFFGLTTSLVLLLMPTSWANYQSVLVIPAITAICFAGPWREDRPVWVFMICAAIFAALTTDATVRQAAANAARNLLHPLHRERMVRPIEFRLRLHWVESLLVLARSLVPLLLWIVHVRLLRGASKDVIVAATGPNARDQLMVGGVSMGTRSGSVIEEGR